MRRHLRWAFLFLVAVACSRGDSSPDNQTQSDTTRRATAGGDTAQARAEIVRLEEELFQSFMRGDTAPAARTLANDYLGFTGDGHRETKAQALANLSHDTGAKATVDSINVDSTTVRVYGNAGVAQTSGTFRAHEGGRSALVGFRNTDMFVWRDERWQIVATHLSKVPPSNASSSR
jgi:hypothetical protein